MAKKRYSEQELCDLIYSCVLAAGDKWVTRKEIAEAIERQKSPHVLRMIEHLVEGGWFEKSGLLLPNHSTVFRYRATAKEAACQDVA